MNTPRPGHLTRLYQVALLPTADEHDAGHYFRALREAEAHHVLAHLAQLAAALTVAYLRDGLAEDLRTLFHRPSTPGQ